MKRKITLTAVLCIVALILLYIFVWRSGSEHTPSLLAIPSNAAVVADIPDLKNFGEILNAESMQQLQSLQLMFDLTRGLNLLISIASSHQELSTDISEGTVTAGGIMLTERKMDFVYVIQLDEAKRFHVEDAGVILRSQKPSVNMHEYEKENIYEFTYGDTAVSFSAAKVFGLFIFSTSSVLTENAVLHLKTGKSLTEETEFKKVYDAVQKKGNASFLFSMKACAAYLASFANGSHTAAVQKLQNFASWVGFHTDVHADEILLKGFASSADDKMLAHTAGNMQDNAQPELEKCYALLPENVASASVLNTEELHAYGTHKLQSTANDMLFEKLHPLMKQVMLSGFAETLSGKFEEKIFIMLPVTDSAAAMQALSGITKPDTAQYKNYPVKKLLNTDVLNALTGFSGVKQYFYTCINSVLLFHTSASQVQNSIEHFIATQHTPAAEQFPATVAQQNFSFYLDLQSAEQIISNVLNTKAENSVTQNFSLFEKFNPVLLQFRKETALFSFEGSITYRSQKSNRISTAWKTLLDAPIVTEPLVIYNHLTRQNNIVVYDSLQQVYLLSADGTITWKKQITSPIHGNVFPVDFYGNNKTQLLFATENNIQMLDLSGNVAEGFQIDFTSAAVNNLAVFTNSATGSYIFFIACDNGNIYGFDKDGKPLQGWSPLQGAGTVHTTLVYAATATEDFFVYANTSNTVFIKNGKGETRRNNQQLSAPLKHSFIPDKKQQPTALLAFDVQGNFLRLPLSTGIIQSTPVSDTFVDGIFADINSDSLADMLYVSPGSITAQTLQGEKIFHTADVLPTSTDYKLAVSSWGGKNYAGAYSHKLQKIFLFHADGNLVSGFPLKGDGPFTVSDLTGTGKHILIAADENYLTAYLMK